MSSVIHELNLTLWFSIFRFLPNAFLNSKTNPCVVAKNVSMEFAYGSQNYGPLLAKDSITAPIFRVTKMEPYFWELPISFPTHVLLIKGGMVACAAGGQAAGTPFLTAACWGLLRSCRTCCAGFQEAGPFLGSPVLRILVCWTHMGLCRDV